PDGFHGRLLDETLTRRFAAAAVAAKLARTVRASSISGTLNGAHHGGTEFQVTFGDAAVAVTDAYFLDGRFRARIGGVAYEAAIDWEPGETTMFIAEGSERYAVQILRLQGGYRLSHGGAQVVATARSSTAASLAALMPKKAPPDTSRLLMCPMPGLVVSINVTEGQDVKSGETLAVVEAMKMENVLVAERDGIIKKVNAKKGDSLALDEVILEFA
ncbi:MAG: biotin/lipoyl-containing protein, partial [Rhizomicrobium sp.]